MVFSSDEDKSIINYLYEKGIHSTEYGKKILRRNGKWLVNKYIKYGTMERQSGSGLQRAARTPENDEMVDELICSQEEEPETHMSPRKIAEEMIHISLFSVEIYMSFAIPFQFYIIV